MLDFFNQISVTFFMQFGNTFYTTFFGGKICLILACNFMLKSCVISSYDFYVRFGGIILLHRIVFMFNQVV